MVGFDIAAGEADAGNGASRHRLARGNEGHAITLAPGNQTLTAVNIGGHTHELVIVKAADAGSLPTKPDGSVDENALKSAKVGEIADVAAGTSKHATFDLAPGTYVAFCNLVDDAGMHTGGGPMGGNGMQHVHYQLGMRALFTVGAT